MQILSGPVHLQRVNINLYECQSPAKCRHNIQAV